MDIFSVFTLLGGLAFFLYGMNTMSKSLEKMAGGKLERLLKRMTSNRWKSLVLGAGITIAIQSSSAMTVMLVGLVNSGVMQVSQTVGVIMGSDIGTTLTAWILSLAGIESGNLFINLLKPENFSPLVAFIGIILIMASKKQRRRDVGRILMGFSILMFSMELMKSAVTPLADSPEFSGLLTAFDNPLVGVLVGTIFTGIIQSSAATIGILQALALTGGITCNMALPIVVGANIGTCVTALISSIGVNKEARQVSVIHISIKIIGGILVMLGFYGGNMLFHFSIMEKTMGAVGVAVIHTVFNLITTVLLMPFSKSLVKMAQCLIKSEDKSKEFAFLDPLLLRTPGVAISESLAMTNEMGTLAQETLLLSLDQLENYDSSRENLIEENENKLDIYEDHISHYLVQASQHGVSMTDSRVISRLLHAVGDFERIGDHALNLQENAREMKEKELNFSDVAKEELRILLAAIREILELSVTCFKADNPSSAQSVEPLEETIDYLIEEIRVRHIQRLQQNQCTVQLGFVLSDILTNLERVSDHCSNIAVSVIEERYSNIDSHAYLNDIKRNATFNEHYQAFQEKYNLPV